MEFPDIEKSIRFDKVRSTDHSDMAATFGVEAGQAGLMEELKRLFKSYSVDSRWLSLVTDRAFFTGVCGGVSCLSDYFGCIFWGGGRGSRVFFSTMFKKYFRFVARRILWQNRGSSCGRCDPTLGFLFTFF